MFARQQEKQDLLDNLIIPDSELNNQTLSDQPLLLKLIDEPRAVLSYDDQRKKDLTEGIKALKKRLELKTVRVKEDLTGQWEKRHRMVLAFLYYQQKNPDNKLTKAATTVAATFGRGEYVARRLREWAIEWQKSRTIARGEQGIYRRMSMWYEDESLLLFMRRFIALSGDKHTSQTLAIAVGEFLYSDEHTERVAADLKLATMEAGEEDGGRPQLYQRMTIRARSARKWLPRLGFRYKDIKKGVYMDGHERPDVVAYRNSFTAKLAELEPLIVQYDENGTIIPKTTLPENTKQLVFCTHDKSTFSANDSRPQAWHDQSQNHLRKKSKGRGIMLSDCLFANGRVHIADSIPDSEMIARNLDLSRRYATEYFEFGKNNEGYWTGEHLVKQITTVVIPMVELLYSIDQYCGLFLFDNAASHACYAEDALRASEMNKESGGKHPKNM